jgi:hypothetical protein
MTDYSWLEPMERRTREIREETQRIKDETEKMKQETHNLPVPDDAPWLDLSQEEVNELRNKKFELTQYGKQKFKEMTTGELMDTEKFQEEFAKSQVFDADKFAEENSMVRNHRILERYNNFYNLECSGLSHGTPITPEFQQAMALECMLDALRYENLNHEFSEVQTADINALIEGLYQQGKDYLEKVRTIQEQAQGNSETDLDAL